MVKKVNEAEFKAEALTGTTVVDFSATWCGPCQMLAPVLEEISDSQGDVKFYNIDVDQNPGITREYGIMNIPAVYLLKDGQVVDKQIGFLPKEQLEAWINQAK
ncbi:MAG: thioredoxin [Roseburia sp.]|uniref:thioredoxin n=1 Tax=Roseburia sp. 831b TaxID=1261635 RepID=UPI00095154FA|nr:thioredoxin [Roseburia sp. 831b]MCI5920105.1 thioredoxin [Roseburia sp.]MDD6216457.1 thioredoxin [Roseburia sp.]MDY5882340.1 thioredoxin [Roseburia sp.]WVK72664.1 thioredoxin [Roseburia sp. 831b]